MTLTSKAKIILLNAPAWQKCKEGELKELLKFITTNEANGDVARIVADAMNDKRTKEITKGGWGMLNDEFRRERKEGKAEGIIEIARKALNMKFSFDVISDLMGLPLEDVKRLSLSL